MLSSLLLFNTFFAVAFFLVRFSEDEGVVQNLVHLDDDDDGTSRVEEPWPASGGPCGACYQVYTPKTQAVSPLRQRGLQN